MAVRAIPLLQGVSRRLQALEEKGFLYSKSFLAFVSFKIKKKKVKPNPKYPLHKSTFVSIVFKVGIGFNHTLETSTQQTFTLSSFLNSTFVMQ